MKVKEKQLSKYIKSTEPHERKQNSQSLKRKRMPKVFLSAESRFFSKKNFFFLKKTKFNFAFKLIKNFLSVRPHTRHWCRNENICQQKKGKKISK